MNITVYILTMRYYALHIKTGSEEKLRELINKEFSGEIVVFCPLRELMIRKKGKTTKQSKPLFSGYIFIEAEEITAEILSKLKKIPGFFQVLPSNKNIKPVGQQDMQFLNSLFGKNHTAHLSKARFDENDRIEIIEGPLKGKEGLIVKVDRRKGRAKIIVNAFNREHLVDMGFELISETANK